MTQEMKRLLREFKSYLTEESNITDAYSVLKLFVNLGVQPGTPEAEIITNIQNIINFSDRFKEAPELSITSPRDVVIAQEKISNKFVQKFIVDLLSKNGLPKEKISQFMNYVSQTTKSPEDIQQAAADYSKEKEEKEKDAYELSDDDVAPLPPQQNKTATARKAVPKPVSGLNQVTPEDSMLARYRKAADDGSKTGF
jgi:hypothetical protein